MPDTNDLLRDVHNNVQSVNPFSSETSHSRRSLLLYRIGTATSWLLLVVTSLVYNFSAPTEGVHHRRTIWGQNSWHHTPFALNAPIVSIYWIVVYTLQFNYLTSFYPPTAKGTTQISLNMAPHFIAHNLLSFGFVHLWCRSHFNWGLLLLIVNFFQLTFAYFRFPPGKVEREGGDKGVMAHIGVLAAPLAFAYVALFWDGAAAFNARDFPARLVANIFIWSWPVYGGFYLIAFKDWAMGFSLSILAAALGVAQFLTVIVAIQWIFAFSIMGLLFVVSAAVAAPGFWGGEPFKRGLVVNSSDEREPLLRQNESA